VWRPSPDEEEGVRRFLSKHFNNLARFSVHEYEGDHDGVRVPILVRWRRKPGKFTIHDTRLRRLAEAGGFLVLAVQGHGFKLLRAEEAVDSGLVKVWRYRSWGERLSGGGRTVPVHVTLSREVLEAVDSGKGSLPRSRYIDEILRRFLGISEADVEL